MEKIFKLSRVNIYINFCLQVHFKVSTAWYCPHYLPPVSLTPVANLPPVALIPVAICRRCCWYQWQFATGVNNTSGTGVKICRRCCWYRWQICLWCCWHRWYTLTCEYLHKFSKKFEMTLMLFSGVWGKVIHEKNLKQNISWRCPFNQDFVDCCWQEMSLSEPPNVESSVWSSSPSSLLASSSSLYWDTMFRSVLFFYPELKNCRL